MLTAKGLLPNITIKLQPGVVFFMSVLRAVAHEAVQENRKHKPAATWVLPFWVSF